MTADKPRRVVVRSTDAPAGAVHPDPPPPSLGSGGPRDGGGAPPSGPRSASAGESGPDGASEPAAVYARGLARTQLRLALACVASFLAVVALLTVAMSAVPALGDVRVAGVPLPWLLHAYGFYPVIAVFALVYALAAARNERRFRALLEDE